MSEPRRPQRWIFLAIGGVGFVVMLALVWIWARDMMSQKVKPQRQVPQVVQIVRPPPPPPDTPPPPPPPPEKIEEPLPKDTPEPEPTPDSPQEQLGLDAEGTAGGDAFGLAARRGGADLVGTGSAIFGRYTALLKDTILSKLSEDDAVRRGSYSVVVRIWVANDGRIEKVALAQSSGKRELDSAIEQALTRLARVSENPPLEMPQPVTLRIVSRG